MAEVYYVGVDVGTASVRAALVTRAGLVMSTAEETISIWEPQSDHYVQSSTEIWEKCCTVVKRVTQGVEKSQVRGIGFDATCSLVVLDQSFQPVPVSQDGDKQRDTVMWMDHRAEEQAARITNTCHRVLRRVGGVMSPEMQPPKLLWLKENLRESCWNKAAHFFDLPDFLSWKATGSLTRVGLKELTIDSVIGADIKGFQLPCEDQPLTSRMAMICGTSTCHMAISKQPLFVPGVWGPCLSAMVPGMWLNEGGQSATGRLIDHMVKGHAAYTQLQERVQQRFPLTGENIFSYLNNHLSLMATSGSVDLLGSSLHVWPDFHGNRSPLADPTLRGMTLDDLALLYLATIQSLALGTLQILEAMKEAGHDIRTLFLCGGLSKNALFVQIHANATALPVVLPDQTEAVLIGAAVLGACASQDYSTVQEAMERMAKVGKVVQPDLELQSFYERKYKVFLRLFAHQREYQALMNQR
ncbi:FGGY carbohydrate kinase domain-containing protein [Liparis tanakae]|uniref:FGGY carbohydrate kinase domain-containing protein n=1 Tax=Liparis tanakae TaxID=230148 RepID=A0A4Z2IUK2_9TELE|nr:FGGY carbohydrate kinase domain-containing protein [Liparis tanakae]